MTRQLEVYWIAGSPYAWRVLLALEVKGAAYDSILMEASKKQQKSPEYLKINPEGTVPALRDGDYVATQSLAILAYLDRKFPNPPLFGASPEDAGTIWKTLLGFDNDLCPLITDEFNRPLFRGRERDMADNIKVAAERLHDAFAGFEAALAGGGWLVGGALSAVDIALYPFIEAALRAAGKPGAKPLKLGFLPFAETYPALEAWRGAIASMPGADNAYPPHWRNGL